LTYFERPSTNHQVRAGGPPTAAGLFIVLAPIVAVGGVIKEQRGTGVDVRIELDVPAPMRDGTVLRANVYRPGTDAGPWPVLLTRLPYGKEVPEELAWLDPLRAVRAGFMVVVQDTRGRFASEGEWDPLRFEREDGFDTVEWAARLPGSNGRVGMFGLSYYGSTQLSAAIGQPPALGAIAPALTWCEPLDGLVARGGAIELGLELPWTLRMGPDHVLRQPLPLDERERRVAELLDDFDRLTDDDGGYRELPVGDGAVWRRHALPGLGAIATLDDPAVAARSRVVGVHERVTVPSLHVAAWHDVFAQGTLDNYTALAALGRPARLVVGPWTHERFADPIGDLCFGVRSYRQGAPAHPEGDLDDVQLAFFRRHLAPNGDLAAEGGAPVRIFVMGRNEWRDEPAWPLARAREERWFLGAGGGLASDPPAPEAAPSEFAYDPADPVPTHGGQLLLAPAFPPGPRDQMRVEAREDVLVFTSERLADELEVTGRVRVVLHARSSAPSTDWVARLCDVHPDGRSFNVCDGIVRVVDGADELRRVEIDLWSTSNVFLAGHRLRVQVTSSCFPRWDRNLNTGDQRSARIEVARQTVHHDAERPSWIELPVIP
jgi:putative CocE/NonD family hydrolase